MTETTTAPEYDAELRAWEMAIIDGFGAMALSGNVYNDKATHGKHPFPDGKFIGTTEVRMVVGGIAHTKSGTRYKLVLG